MIEGMRAKIRPEAEGKAWASPYGDMAVFSLVIRLDALQLKNEIGKWRGGKGFLGLFRMVRLRHS